MYDDYDIDDEVCKELAKYIHEKVDGTDCFQEYFYAKKIKDNKVTFEHSGKYYEVTINTILDLYDSKFGDDKKCECGHVYYRHFDSYTVNMDPVGCKYCYCGTFKEKDVVDESK